MTRNSADIASELLKKAEVSKTSSTKTKKATTTKKEEKFKLSKDRSILEQALEQTPNGIEVASAIDGVDVNVETIRDIPILYEGNKSRFVYGEGNKSADVMFVGEAPGYDEDEQCRPFVGKAGQVLRQCLNDAGIDAKDIWLTNTVKQRPPQNRDPKPLEIFSHMPYLIREILDVKPKVIVLTGNVPLQAFLNRKGITKEHGKIFTLKFSFGEVKIIPVFHPSYVMRREEDKVTKIKYMKDLTTIRKLVSNSPDEEKATNTKYTLIETLDQFKLLMSKINSAEVVDFDLETHQTIAEKDKIICISFSITPYKAAVVPLCISWKDKQKVDIYKYWGDKHDFVMSELKKFFESDIPKCAQAGHLIDLPFLVANGIDIKRYEYDTIIMHHLLDENVQMENRGLKDFAWEYTDMGGYDAKVEEWKDKLKEIEKARLKKLELPIPKKVPISFGDIPFDELWPYAAADADVLGRVRRILWDKMKKQGLTALCKKISIPLQVALCEIEKNGVTIDREKLRAIKEEYDGMEKDVDKQLASHIVTERTKEILIKRAQEKAKTPAQKEKIAKKFEESGVNYGSSQQLAVALFEVAGLKPVKYTAGKKPSTDKEVLEELATQHEIPKLISQKRKYGYFQKYYGEKFENLIRSDGRIHTVYYVYGTTTGRLSSRDPNLQNIPRADEGSIAGRIRSIFVAKPGHVLLDADYSQIEFRLLANYTQDPQMIADIESDRDIHIINATFVSSNKSYDEITPQERQDAKPLTYAMIYGATDYRLMELYGISRDRAQEILDAMFSRYPRAKEFHNMMIDSARTKGYVQNIFGRRRRLVNILSDNKGMRGHAERQAINAPIQSLAGEILSIATIRLHRFWKDQPDLAKMVLTVHDSLTHECLESDADRVVANVYREMTKPIPGITIPIPVEVKIGKSYGDMKKITPEEIEKILASNT